MSMYHDQLPKPNPRWINTQATYVSPRRFTELLGKPRGVLGTSCETRKAPSLILEQCISLDVGPFNMYGVRPWVEFVRDRLRILKVRHPELYDGLTHHGTLCPRLMRGSRIPSQHTWIASDFGIFGRLDPLGAEAVSRGYFRLYDVLKPLDGSPGAHWGASYNRTDAMHFSPSEELLASWISAGTLRTL